MEGKRKLSLKKKTDFSKEILPERSNGGFLGTTNAAVAESKHLDLTEIDQENGSTVSNTPTTRSKRLLLMLTSDSLATTNGYKPLSLPHSKITAKPRFTYKKLPESCHQCTIIRLQKFIRYDNLDDLLGGQANDKRTASRFNQKDSWQNSGEKSEFQKQERTNDDERNTSLRLNTKQIGVKRQDRDRDSYEKLFEMRNLNQRKCVSYGKLMEVQESERLPTLDAESKMHHDNNGFTSDAATKDDEAGENMDSDLDIIILDMPESSFSNDAKGLSVKRKSNQESRKMSDNGRDAAQGDDNDDLKYLQRHRENLGGYVNSPKDVFQASKRVKKGLRINDDAVQSKCIEDDDVLVIKEIKGEGKLKGLTRIHSKQQNGREVLWPRIEKDSAQSSRKFTSYENDNVTKNIDCPMCLMQYPPGWTEEMKSQHVSGCISNDFFLDEDVLML